MHTQNHVIKVIPYTSEYATFFESLNREWIEAYYSIEPPDLYQLQNPEEAILKDGGEIFFAQYLNEIIGTVALIKKNRHEYEMAKMAVHKPFQGIGAGRKLCERVIEEAKNKNAQKIFLYSNTKLESAIALYRKMGFREIPLEPEIYQRANIKMELVLKQHKKFEQLNNYFFL